MAKGGSDRERIRQANQQRFNEIEDSIKNINRLHVLICDGATKQQSRAIEPVFDEINRWRNHPLRNLKAIMGCA
jgi:cell division GTPase FtsZ